MRWLCDNTWDLHSLGPGFNPRCLRVFYGGGAFQRRMPDWNFISRFPKCSCQFCCCFEKEVACALSWSLTTGISPLFLTVCIQSVSLTYADIGSHERELEREEWRNHSGRRKLCCISSSGPGFVYKFLLDIRSLFKWMHNKCKILIRGAEVVLKNKVLWYLWRMEKVTQC